MIFEKLLYGHDYSYKKNFNIKIETGNIDCISGYKNIKIINEIVEAIRKKLLLILSLD